MKLQESVNEWEKISPLIIRQFGTHLGLVDDQYLNEWTLKS